MKVSTHYYLSKFIQASLNEETEWEDCVSGELGILVRWKLECSMIDFPWWALYISGTEGDLLVQVMNVSVTA